MPIRVLKLPIIFLGGGGIYLFCQSICFNYKFYIQYLPLGVYMVWFGWFWRGFLYHTYRVRFHPILDRTSFLIGKNRSTQDAIDLSGSVWFIRLYGYRKKIMWLSAKEKRKMVGGSLKIWDWEGNTTNCSVGLAFGRNIMWLRGKKNRKMVR